MIFENQIFRFVLGEDAVPQSLYCKKTGEECLTDAMKVPMFSAVQERPYNGEVKLAYLNKQTKFSAARVVAEGSRLTVTFDVLPFRALVDVKVADRYLAFTLAGLEASEGDYPSPMDFPPVYEFVLAELPFEKRYPFGDWLNVVHLEQTSVSLLAAEPMCLIDADCVGEVRFLSARAHRDIKLQGCTAVLAVAPKTEFLDVIETVENDLGLPSGVKSRRNPLTYASIYRAADVCPENVEKHIAIAKKGGFSLICLCYTCMFRHEESGYAYCGEYLYNDSYPNGKADMQYVLDKLHEAGLHVGVHFLHTHVGVKTKYVAPVADRRLNLKKCFTLSKNLGTEDDVVYVDECPYGAPLRDEKIRLLRFDGEVISYEGYSTSYPYCFTGCKRGYFGTTVSAHSAYTVGGVLDVSEFSRTSIYLNQKTDLQDEIGDQLAELYNMGFEFIYYDGSEGTNAPFSYHVGNAQYRMYQKMKVEPIFCEGSAKSHFSWHIMSGNNAFDAYPAHLFKQMIVKHPCREAMSAKNDFTRVNFGFWNFDESTTIDQFEFGTSKALAYNCPITVISHAYSDFQANPRYDGIFEMLRRWEKLRNKNLLTNEQKELLKNPEKEYTLLCKQDGTYLLSEICLLRLGQKNNRITAYHLLDAEGLVVSVCDNRGTSYLTLPATAVIGYTGEIDAYDLPMEKNGDYVTVKVSDRAYLHLVPDTNVEAVLSVIG